MSVQIQEGRIILAIEALCTTRKMSVRQAAKTYNVPETSLRARMKGRVARAETRSAMLKLTSEEETRVRRILDLDSRGFPPRIIGVEDMANLLLAARDAKRVGTRWAYCFIQRRPELKTRFSRAYDFQRALCEDHVLKTLSQSSGATAGAQASIRISRLEVRKGANFLHRLRCGST